MVHMASEVAQKLEDERISVEIIDLRTIAPLDIETILTSIDKTSKALIVHEGESVQVDCSQRAQETIVQTKLKLRAERSTNLQRQK